MEQNDYVPVGTEPAPSIPKKRHRIGRIILLSLLGVLLLALLIGGILYLSSDYKAFKDLQKDYKKRINGEKGIRVTDVEEFEDFYYFSVEVTVKAESDPTGEPFVVSSATALCFRDEESANKSYEGYKDSPLETCLKEGKILIFWRSDDPFQDLYQEVFNKAFE